MPFIRNPQSKQLEVYAPHRPVIGRKFAGPNCYHDTQNGVFWAVMQKLTENECKVQRALLAPQRK